MAISLVDLSPQAQLVLEAHAREPGKLFYATETLYGHRNAKDIDRLDQAYMELKHLGLLEPTVHVIVDSGIPKRLYKITDAGRRLAQQLIDATATTDLER